MIKALGDKLTPRIDPSCFIADSAEVMGSVTIGADSSVWYKAVLRGDVDSISVGCRTNIQDLTMVHCDEGLPTVIGDDVTIGHSAIIHACTIGNKCQIGMGAIILDGAVIGDGCIIGAGAVVPPRMEVPPLSQVMGIPGRVVKTLTPDKAEAVAEHSRLYAELAQGHKQAQEK